MLQCNGTYWLLRRLTPCDERMIQDFRSRWITATWCTTNERFILTAKRPCLASFSRPCGAVALARSTSTCLSVCPHTHRSTIWNGPGFDPRQGLRFSGLALLNLLLHHRRPHTHTLPVITSLTRPRLTKIRHRSAAHGRSLATDSWTHTFVVHTDMPSTATITGLLCLRLRSRPSRPGRTRSHRLPSARLHFERRSTCGK